MQKNLTTVLYTINIWYVRAIQCLHNRVVLMICQNLHLPPTASTASTVQVYEEKTASQP